MITIAMMIKADAFMASNNGDFDCRPLLLAMKDNTRDYR